MRFCNKNRPAVEIGVFNEDIFRREFVKAIKDGHICGLPVKKGKRFRSAFTTEQVKYLENEFRKYPYIGNARRKDVSNVLKIPERAIKIWFQNRRMKEKKDTTNKESDSDKFMEAVQSNNDVSSAYKVKSTNDDGSLPLFTNSASPRSKEFTVNRYSELKHVKKNYYKDLSVRDDEYTSGLKTGISITAQSISELKTPHISLSSLKKCKTEKNNDVVKEKLAADTDHQKTHTSHVSHVQFPREHQNMCYPLHGRPPSTISHGLSSKPDAQPQGAQSEQMRPEINYSPGDSSFYLNHYALPYASPGNILWNPLNFAPFVASAPTSALTISSPASTVYNPNMKKANCDCATRTMMQNNSLPNVQYVITAVPFQNHSLNY